MATKYGKKKSRQNIVFYTIITAILICAVFLSMVTFFYTEAEEEAYEMLHIQTKQIKDDLTLQLNSDKENLITMANFASKLYADGKGYDRMFDSFKPIGLFSRIGILNPDGTFITKDGTYDLSGKISFADEAAKGEHITGRTYSYSIPGEEVVRSTVPIKVNGETVGLIYGIIKIEKINEKYGNMAKELNAQLFVYDKETGKFIIDTIEQSPGELSELKNRKYNDGYSYEELVTTDKGFTSFKSIRTGEDLYVHYSTIDDFGWGILLARYSTQVFARTHLITSFISVLFLIIMLIIVTYILVVLRSERRATIITRKASEIRKLLLEVNQQNGNIKESLKTVMQITRSRSAVFVDIEGEDYNFVNAKYENDMLKDEDKKYFLSELFRYAVEIRKTNNTSVGVMSIKPDKHLIKTNEMFYSFLKKKGIQRVTFATVMHANNNNVSVLCTINPQKNFYARVLLEDIAVCFSIAIFNKNHLNKTYTAATTDALTNVLNRVAYKKDLLALDEEKPKMFSCIYIDVNELHLRNNKYGHAAGDEMLIYIANALKSVFYGHSIYRMGGDEFLVFVKDTEQETIKRCIDAFKAQLALTDYNVAIGISYRSHNKDTEEMVREAEIRMYEAKAEYYQNKEKTIISRDEDNTYAQTRTGILEIDTMISVLKEHYNGIYKVSLDNDNAHRILMPAYLGYNEDEKHFSRLMTKYVDEFVHPDSYRAVTSFLNYDAVKRQISEGNIPRISYKKVNGENVILSIYKMGDDEIAKDTLWVFEKD